MNGDIIFITGTSSGIGRSLAEVLVTRGHTVFGSSRKGETNAPAGVTQVALDVTDDASVERAVAEIEKKAGRIDILINNAGVVQLGAVEELSVESMKANYDTNVFGVVRMVQAVLPGMRSRRAGRIFNIGSVAGTASSPYLSSYCSSKFALEAINQSLRVELKPFNIKVSLLGPSYVKSGILERDGRAAGRFDDYAPGRQTCYARFDHDLEHGEDTRAIAEEMATIVEVKSPKPRYAVGKGARQFTWISRLTPASFADVLSYKYWKLDKAYARASENIP